MVDGMSLYFPLHKGFIYYIDVVLMYNGQYNYVLCAAKIFRPSGLLYRIKVVIR